MSKDHERRLGSRTSWVLGLGAVVVVGALFVESLDDEKKQSLEPKRLSVIVDQPEFDCVIFPPTENADKHDAPVTVGSYNVRDPAAVHAAKAVMLAHQYALITEGCHDLMDNTAKLPTFLRGQKVSKVILECTSVVENDIARSCRVVPQFVIKASGTNAAGEVDIFLVTPATTPNPDVVGPVQDLSSLTR